MAGHEDIIASNSAELVKRIDCTRTLLWERLIELEVIAADDVDYIKVGCCLCQHKKYAWQTLSCMVLQVTFF